jgi:uncharacterized protein VirK/YbjX
MLANPRFFVPSAPVLFNRTDDGAGGVLQTWKRQIKFQWRYWRYRTQMQSIAAMLDRHGLTSLVNSDPQLLMRPLRSYLWGGLNAETRTQAVISHFDWFLDGHSQNTSLQLYREGRITVARFSAEEQEIRFDLEPGRRLGREGELELHLRLHDQTALRCAFSVLPGHICGEPTQARLMVIGNMQGGDHGPDLVKEVTHLSQKTRPRTLLLTALQGLAQGWGVTGIRGVSAEAHAYASYRSLSKRVMVDYDELWKDLGSTERQGAHWQLDAVPHLRPAEDVPSRKRAELRRRNALRQDLFDQCAQWGQEQRQSAAQRRS